MQSPVGQSALNSQPREESEEEVQSSEKMSQTELEAEEVGMQMLLMQVPGQLKMLQMVSEDDPPVEEGEAVEEREELLERD